MVSPSEAMDLSSEGVFFEPLIGIDSPGMCLRSNNPITSLLFRRVQRGIGFTDQRAGNHMLRLVLRKDALTIERCHTNADR